MRSKTPLMASALVLAAAAMLIGCGIEAPIPVTVTLENSGGGELLVIAHHDSDDFASDGGTRYLDLEGRRSDQPTTEFRLPPGASRTLRLPLHQETVVNPHPPAFMPRLLRERYAQSREGRLRIRNLGDGPLDVAVGNDVTRPAGGFRLPPGEVREVDAAGVQVRLNPRRGLEFLRQQISRRPTISL